MPRVVFLAVACLALSFVSAQPPEALISFETLDNQAVMKLVRDGIPDHVIVAAIESTPGEFDTSASAIAELKQSGVSDAVIKAMIDAANERRSGEAPPAAPPSPPPVPARPAEVVPPVAASNPPASQAPAADKPSGPATLPPPAAVATEQAAPPPPAPPTPARPAPAQQPTARSPEPGVAGNTPASISGSQPASTRMGHVERRDRRVPRVELFGGYVYWLSDRRPNVAGWNASVTANVTRWFGVVTDFSKQSENRSALGINFGSINAYRILAGPQLAVRGGPVSGFVRGLIGGSHIGTLNRTPASWHMAYGIGGGLDIRVASGLAVRPIQWDAVFTDQTRETRTDHRLSFGAVARF
jgi:hypothetical protein